MRPSWSNGALSLLPSTKPHKVEELKMERLTVTKDAESGGGGGALGEDFIG